MLLMEPEGPSILLILTTTADHQSLLFSAWARGEPILYLFFCWFDCILVSRI